MKVAECINTQPKLGHRVDHSFVILQLIKAGKLNTLTIFDLDDFYDICFQVSTSSYVGYPAFYYTELL